MHRLSASCIGYHPSRLCISHLKDRIVSTYSRSFRPSIIVLPYLSSSSTFILSIAQCKRSSNDLSSFPTTDEPENVGFGPALPTTPPTPPADLVPPPGEKCPRSGELTSVSSDTTVSGPLRASEAEVEVERLRGGVAKAFWGSRPCSTSRISSRLPTGVCLS